MKPSFLLRSSHSSTRSSAQASLLWWTLAAAGLCALLPLLWKIVNYRRDLAVRNRIFPACPPLGEEDRLLVLAPHPDDETLGAGGLIFQARQKNLAVRVVFLTNGDGSGSTRIGETLRQKQRPTHDEIAALRQREATNALAKLGVAADDIIFLGYPDGGLGKLWRDYWDIDNAYRSAFTGADSVPYANAFSVGAPYAGQSVVRDLLQIIEEFRPTRALTTDGNDTHEDHRAAFCFLLAALEQFQLQSSTRIDFWTYLVHHAIWPVPHGDRPNDVLAPPDVLTQIGAKWNDNALDSQARNAKRAALECYESQMTWTPNYLRGFLRRNEIFNLADSSTRLDNATPLLRDPVKDSPTRHAFSALDIQRLNLVPSTNDILRIQIETRAAISHQANYGLLLHALSESSEQSYCWQMTAKYENGSWRAFLQNDEIAFKVEETSSGLIFDIPRPVLPNAQTLLISASSQWNGKTIDETSTIASRLDA